MLHIHRSERADLLVDGLADLLAGTVDDPMQAELVAVPTRGVERWVTQRLSHRLGASPNADDGVCANIRFVFPATVVAEVLAAGSDLEVEEDLWAPERAVWPLIRVIDRDMDESYLEPLASHLRGSSPRDFQGRRQVRRYATARHLADLFDRYAFHRPDMVLAWAEGNPWQGGATGPHEDWQSELWRRLRAEIGTESPAELARSAFAAVAADPAGVKLPARLSVFGLTRLAPSHVRALRALAVHREVHIFLLHPSGVLWDRIDGAGPPPDHRRSAEGAPTARNPLLRSWGRDAREMQLVLASEAGPAESDYRPVQAGSGSLLETVQAAVRADQPPVGTGLNGSATDPRPVLDPADRSLTVHSCHGRARQVEVVRDAVLHLLEQDPTLELRDIIVMCPDIEAFAPLVHAAFRPGGAGDRGQDGEDVPAMRVRLADRSLHQTNPLLAVANDLLALAGARVTASEVLDLLSMEAVARRFHLDEDELDRLRTWAAGSGVRWGIGDAQRVARGLGNVGANTWRSGLDRLLLGVAMSEDELRLYGGTLPLDDVPGSSVELAGRLSEAVERLAGAMEALSGPQSLDDWMAALGRAVETMAEPALTAGWQRDELRRVLSEVAATAGDSGLIDLGEVRGLMASRLEGRPTRANFRTGDLTICTLVPMRSVPHRVVCLMGLDDGVFPRHTGDDGDDILLVDPQVGDRDPRREDRQLLLDALLAATERLVITYNGRDIRSNQVRHPAVPVSELLDFVDRSVRHSDPAKSARAQIVTEHPLQAFDWRNFVPGSLKVPGPWSFDPVSLAGARAFRRGAVEAAPFLPERLDALDSPVIDLDDLVRFVETPVKSFLRERLGLHVRSEGEEPGDGVPLHLSALEEWGVADKLLRARLAGAAVAEATAAELARGSLPPGPLAEAVLAGVSQRVEGIVAACEAETDLSLPAESLEVNLVLPDGRSLIGSVPGIRGNLLLSPTCSRLAAKHRLGAWVRFLALNACRPERELTTLTVGRGRSNKVTEPVASARLARLEGNVEERRALAIALLADLVDLYDRGMREPLPLYCKTSAAWVAAVAGGREEQISSAEGRWQTEYIYKAEDEEPEHVLVLGRSYSFDSILAEAPTAYDPRPSEASGRSGQTSRFALYAHRLWDDICLRESLSGVHG